MSVVAIANVKVTGDKWLPALLEFPSMAAVEAFASDWHMRPVRGAAQAGSVSRFHVLDNTDVAGTIPYLPKG